MESETPAAADLIEIHVLDDNQSTRNLAKTALENHLSCAVKVCSTATDLFALAAQSKPDLILLDVDLNNEGNLNICLRLKNDPETENIPIVFLSNYDSPSKRVAALKAGGVDYIDKPFYPEELVTRIKTHIEVYRLQRALMNQMNEQRALLRVLCHDLVNPLFAAQGLLSMRLEAGQVNEDTAKVALNCCNSAMDLISHIREENTLVSKDKQFKTEAVNIADAFREAMRTLRNRFNKKGVALTAKADPNATLNINRVVLVHNILNNLLTNALKFSYPNSEVNLKGYLKNDGCIIEVIDQGVGMPPEILENLFVDDAKISRNGTDSEKGTGFGMPLVKRYVEKSAGAIEVESIERSQEAAAEISGTTIRLSFPNQGA